MSGIPVPRLAAYGVLGLPLAMAALPIYVHVPKFYADTLGLGLASVGLLLLAARIFDAVQDPLLGYWSDRFSHHRWGRLPWVVAGAPLLAGGMVGLFMPPPLSDAGTAGWLLAMLLLVYTAYSMITISYQAHGAALSRDAAERTRVTAWREGLGLIGVFLAAALPELLAGDAVGASGARRGFEQFSFIFAPLLLLLAAVTVLWSPPVVDRRLADAGAGAPPRPGLASLWLPLANPRFRPLLLVFVLNGIAAAIPATLVLFFVQDVIQRPDLTALFLIAYFLAGAAGMPLWTRLSARIGKPQAWLCGMLLSILAFIWAFVLDADDVWAFGLICALSGLGLGADLTLPPSILADVIDHDERAGKRRQEGVYFGLWNLVTKANLALAAGIALPALAWLGYDPGSGYHRPEVLTALAGVYALLPCVLKTAAAFLLWSSTLLDDHAPIRFEPLAGTRGPQ